MHMKFETHLLRISVAAAVFCVALYSSLTLNAAELRLKSDCQASSGLVHVGDVAEIFTKDPADARALAEIDLFAAPAAGQKRTLRARELQDLLALRGVN